MKYIESYITKKYTLVFDNTLATPFSFPVYVPFSYEPV